MGGESPAAIPISLTPHLILHPPLSRHGHGPGLILIADHYAPLAFSDKTLDPPPLQKWAEEGFAVAQILVPASGRKEFPLNEALDALQKMEQCDFEGKEGEGVGVVSYLTHIPFYVEEVTRLSPTVHAIISHSPKPFASIRPDAKPTPQLLHIAGSQSSPITPKEPSSKGAIQTSVKIHTYPTLSQNDSNWILPASPAYNSASANVAHTRSLEFLKPILKGPYFDIEAVWEEHTKFEFVERDVGKTMATMVSQPYVNHVPTMTGGIGKDRLTAFYTHHFIFSNPPDTSLELLSRSVSINRIIDEFLFLTTHTHPIPWLLPGVPPTNRQLRFPMTSIVTLRGDRLCHEHIHWDQGTVLMQLKLMPEWLPFPYEIQGNTAGQGKRFEIRPPCVGAEGAEKAVDEQNGESNMLILREEKGEAWREADNF